MQKEQRFQLGEFWLSKRSDGASDAWQITWLDRRTRQTRQRSTRTSDFELAQKRLAEHFIAKGQWHKEPDAIVVEVLQRYRENHGKKVASHKFVDYAIGHWSTFWKGALVSDMTEDHLEEFVDAIPGQGKKTELAPRTVNRILGVGRAALRRALRRKELVSAPFIAMTKVGRTHYYRATPQEVAQHLNATQGMPWVRQWIIGSIVTLARPDAVLTLSRPQMNFQDRRIDLLPPGQVQTHKGRSIIPMTQVAHEWMKGAWTGYWITYPAKKGARPLASIRMGFERTRARAGLTDLITPYTYRRTMATELRRRGVDAWEIAGFMGHSEDEWAQTEDYAIYSPDYLGAAARAIDAYCVELQALLDFDLRTSCVPQPMTPGRPVAPQAPVSFAIEDLGRLGLEPRTNTLKGSDLPSKVSHLKRRG